VLKSPRFLNRKDAAEDLEATTKWLLSAEGVEVDLLSLGAEGNARKELRERNAKFREVTKLSGVQCGIALRALQVLGDYCAKRSLSLPLQVAWEKVKEGGLEMREQSVSTYLYVLGSSPSLSLGSILSSEAGNSILDLLSVEGVVNNDTTLEEKIDIPGEVATFHDLLYKPTENSITLRVKGMVAKGFAKKAEALVDTLKDKDDNMLLRLRTYLPVLKAYCDQGDCDSALKLYHRMQNSPGVIMEPENYVLLFAALAENGYFKSTSPPLPSAPGLSYPPMGPALLDALAEQMAASVLEITSASARRLYNAFYTSFHSTYAIPQFPPLATLPVNNQTVTPEEIILDRVTIDSTTGKCPRSNIKLRLILLDDENRRKFHDGLLKMSGVTYQQYTDDHGFSLKDEAEGHAEKELRKFAQFLDERQGEPFTAIIDGANAAYFGQNFDQGRFNYHQIQFLVDALESKGERALVTIPQKYTQTSFFSNTGSRAKRQYLREDEIEIMNRLDQAGKLYKVPARCLDDYYWMLASVSNQTTSRGSRNLDVDSEDVGDRWPGTRPMLLSNDQMRDHKMELLEPRLFRRWTSSHLVNYNFTPFVGMECVDREIGFVPVDFFSREIQGNVRDGGGMVWHFPVQDWDTDERFSIGIPNHS